MADYPYTQNQSSLKSFLSHIQSAGVPQKVTQQYLVQCGYKSTNDRRIIGVLKTLNLIDSNGVPTSNWQAFRDKSKAPGILAGLIKATYADLFSTYPDAQNKDEEALRNFFSANTNLGAKALGLTVSTFKTLADQSSFGTAVAPVAPVNPAPTQEASTIIPAGITKTQTSAGITVNINIELAIPPTDKPEVFDAFFAAMKKHLLDDE